MPIVLSGRRLVQRTAAGTEHRGASQDARILRRRHRRGRGSGRWRQRTRRERHGDDAAERRRWSGRSSLGPVRPRWRDARRARSSRSGWKRGAGALARAKVPQRTDVGNGAPRGCRGASRSWSSPRRSGGPGRARRIGAGRRAFRRRRRRERDRGGRRAAGERTRRGVDPRLDVEPLPHGERVAPRHGGRRGASGDGRRRRRRRDLRRWRDHTGDLRAERASGQCGRDRDDERRRDAHTSMVRRGRAAGRDEAGDALLPRDPSAIILGADVAPVPHPWRVSCCDDTHCRRPSARRRVPSCYSGGTCSGHPADRDTAYVLLRRRAFVVCARGRLPVRVEPLDPHIRSER
jgi:hypothetical protein